MPKISKTKAAEIAFTIALAGLLVGLPIYTQTYTIPFAVVQGNSMYPTLHNGDLVIFTRAPSGEIANRTIIVFVQGDTGISGLDSIVRPVVIHRIVGTQVQSNGELLYQTKGDNNEFVDPSLTPASNVLGVPLVVIPRAGLLVQFVESPEGLVALIGMISLYYLGKYEVKLNEDKTKEGFLEELTNLVMDGELSRETFEYLELVVKYGKKLSLGTVEDELVQSLGEWVRKGGLDRKWKVEKVDCPSCSARATRFVSGKDNVFLFCPRCSNAPKLVVPNITS